MLPTATSCMAATGATLAALRAGETAATIVTARPARPAMRAVRAVNTIPPAGRPKPSPLSMAFRPMATATPAASPISDAMMPTTTASSSTEPSTCRLLAPSARIRPFSLVRCATVMENVLKIMKAPTSSATTAKISRKVLKNDSTLAN